MRFSASALTLAALAAAIPFCQLEAEEKSAGDREEAAKALMRPVCADKSARDTLVARMIENGGEYEKATAKWDLDVACEMIDLPTTAVHETADLADSATHTDWLYDARWSPDGTRIVTAGRDGSVRIWDAATGETIKRIDIAAMPARKQQDGAGIVRATRFLGDGSVIVVTADAHPIRLIDVASGGIVGELDYAPPDPGYDMPPFMETTASGLVVIGGYRGPTIVFDTKTKSELYRLPAWPDDYPRFAVSGAAGLIATTAPAGERSVGVQIRKLETGEILWQTEAEGDPTAYSLEFSRDGSRLAVAVRGQAYIYDVKAKKLLTKILIYPTFGSFEVAFSADGSKLIAGQRHAQLWDIATGRRLLHFGPYSDLCHTLDVSPDGKYLVTSHIGSDGRVWEIDTGKFFRRLGKNVYPKS